MKKLPSHVMLDTSHVKIPNQGSTGSSVGHAVVAMIEYEINNSRKQRYERRDKAYDSKSEKENIVKSYPSIPYGSESHVLICAFDKLDGSNVRAEWTKKKGWHKFGTRHRLVDVTDPVFGKVPELILNKYGDPLASALDKRGYERAMCFFEFWGHGSFAGMHDPNEQQTVTLFDVAPFGKGILDPGDFLPQFGHLDVPKVLYMGEVDSSFIDSVRGSYLKGMTFEGVVCKGSNDKKTKMPIMFKQKSKAWLDKLGEYCGNNRDLFNALI